jgi:hypothetical protein
MKLALSKSQTYPAKESPGSLKLYAGNVIPNRLGGEPRVQIVSS